MNLSQRIALVLLTSFLGTTIATHVTADDNNLEPKEKMILLPIGYYTPETSAALGGLLIYNIKKEAEGRTSNILSSLSYTLKQQSIFILAPKYYLKGGDTELYLNIRYLYFPAEYYGRGNETRVEDLEHFTQNIYTMDGGVKYKFYNDFFVTPFGSYQEQIIVENDGAMVEAEKRFGFGEYTQRSLGFNLGVDSRDYHNSPLKGLYYFMTYSQHWFRNPQGLMPDPGYKNYELDLRHYISMGEKKVLAANFFIAKEEGHSVPFQFLNKLGGGNALRGYLSGRFRDKAISFLQADYRCDFAPRFAYSVFAGFGVVAPDTDTLLENRRRHTVGAGVHYLADVENRQKIRLDVGIGENDYGVYVVFGEAY